MASTGWKGFYERGWVSLGTTCAREREEGRILRAVIYISKNKRAPRYISSLGSTSATAAAAVRSIIDSNFHSRRVRSLAIRCIRNSVR